ncbi:MAG: hypothetical protein JWN72_2517 [Thermoleophilia bacterium]|nr:hypothetical protein [Thermoleophilia bacterium]
MSLRNRILDMLPVLLVFAAVAAFATYVIVAYIEHDVFWLHTLAQHGVLPLGPDQAGVPHASAGHRAVTHAAPA